jgi:hypothetical protein
VQHAGQADIFDILPLTAQQGWIFAAPQRSPNQARALARVRRPVAVMWLCTPFHVLVRG